MDSSDAAASVPDAAQHDPQHEGQQQKPEMKLLAHRPARSEAPLPPLDTDLQSANDAAPGRGDAPRQFYSSAQWTADGTTIIVGGSDNSVSAFVLPADLLQSAAEDRRLEPQATTRLPEPTQAIVAAPFFSLAEPASQTFLVGCRDHPLHLYHAFPQDEHPNPVGTYKLVRKETEEYITPASLIWQYPGTHFLCGSANRLDYFDVSRHGSDGPLLTVPTIPSRRHIAKGSGVGMKGTVAALATSPHDANGGSIVAAGTWTRWMGLYDLQRTDKVVANWNISNAGDAKFGSDLGGQGIVQVAWSPCGRYLLVNERHSSSLLVYDIRGAGQLLSALAGRTSATQQRLACDVFRGDIYGNTGFEVWAGSLDGSVLVWEDVGMHYGVAQPSWDWKAHESPVGSTVLHSCGSVAATCSGGWEHAPDHVIGGDFGTGRGVHSDSRILDESSLKVWSIGAQG
ncbi:Guanine nucleotide-binding protein negative regulator 1 [Tolypocladium ophioglossoides CBS 100239]|uniref:Guanine nucleotide-binding protein negative regulator 1 n=1 Tax=Tolypocladium ophioglossoides (strain CBS 100239) TaxID=1163406 RepID=A0A0L0NGI7_TOLOC|nr:Guanine nucleotide-binding protein negative regulator 1 [Tolypocladium ophioglossoides CBS 100239]